MKTERKKQIRYNRRRKLLHAWKAVLFLVFLFAMGIWGMLLFLRPSSSLLERRNLTAFPQFHIGTFLSGEYFKDISTWYADTFPGREGLIAANMNLKTLYGLNKEQVTTATTRKGDQIPDHYVPAGTQAPADDQTAGTVSGESSAEILPTETPGPDGSLHNKEVEVSGGDVYIAQGKGFELFYFSLEHSNAYIDAVNSLAASLQGKASVYDLLAPINSNIILGEDMQQKLDNSDGDQARDYIYNHLDSSVTTVNVFDTLRNHNSEYIYYNTDHHWTALGAYYAYRELARSMGFRPHELSDYTTHYQTVGFLGTFYTRTQSKDLQNNPDTLDAYVPVTWNEMTGIDRSDHTTGFTSEIVRDPNTLDPVNAYSAFICGDQDLSEIHNPNVSNGRSCVVIKDSYGNCLIPFLTDHFSDIYIVDYRYFTGSLSSLVTEHAVDTVLLVNNIGAVNDMYQIGQITACLGN